MVTNRIVAAALLLSLAASCNSIRAFEGAARVHGGHDGPDGEDVIFLELRNIEGRTTGAYGLVLPRDWTARPVARDESGRLIPDPPVVPVLTPGAETEPKLVLLTTSGEFSSGDSHIHAPGSLPLLVIRQDGALDESAVEEEVSTRLEVGASAYALVRPDGASAMFDASLFGARFLPATEGSGDVGTVQWVFLGDVALEDQRGWFAKSGDIVLRQTPNAIFGTVGLVYLAGVFTSPFWIWFVI